MPDSSSNIEGIRIDTKSSSVDRKNNVDRYRRGLGVDPCIGIELSATRDRPNEGVIINAIDTRSDNPDFSYKVEGGTYQNNNLISGLPEGLQTFRVKEKNKNCVREIEKEVIHCDLTLSTTVDDELYGRGDGSIEAAATTSSDNVQWSFDGGSWFSGSKTQSWTSLSAGTYTVKVTDEWGCTQSRDVVVENTEDTSAPTVPENLTSTYTGDIELGWDASTDSETSVSHYKIYRSTQSGFTADSNTLVADNITNTSWIDTENLSADRYYYKVSAVDDAGNESSGAKTDEYYGNPPPEWENREDVLWLIENSDPIWDDKGDIEANRQPEWTATDNYTYGGEANNKPSWDSKTDLFADSQPQLDTKEDILVNNESSEWTVTDNYTYTK